MKDITKKKLKRPTKKIYWDKKMQILEKWAKMKNLLQKDDYLSISRGYDGSYMVFEENDFESSSVSFDAKSPGKALDQALAAFSWRLTHMHKNVLNWSRIKLELAIMGA